MVTNFLFCLFCLSYGTLATAKRYLNGFPVPDTPIRVGVPQYAPYVNPCIAVAHEWDLEECPQPGMDFEIAMYLINWLNVSYELVPLGSPSDWGMTPDSGILGEISRGEYDFPSVWYKMTNIRVPHFQWASPLPYQYFKQGFVLQKLGGGMSLKATSLLYMVFSGELWLMTFVVVIMLCILLVLSDNLKKWKNGGLMKSVRDVQFQGIWSTLSLILEHYEGSPSMGILSGNITMVIFGFTLLFIIALYEGGLVGALITKHESDPFNDIFELSDVVQSGKYKIVSDGQGAFFWSRLANSQLTSYKTFNESIENTGGLIIADGQADAVKMLNADPKLVYPGNDFLNAVYLIRGQCKLQFIVDESSASMADNSFIFKPGNPWRDLMYEAMSASHSAIHKIEEKYIKQELEKNNMICEELEASELDPLKMQHFYGLIGLCALLFVIALGTLIGEAVMSVVNKRKRKRIEERRKKIKAKAFALARLGSADAPGGGKKPGGGLAGLFGGAAKKNNADKPAAVTTGPDAPAKAGFAGVFGALGKPKPADTTGGETETKPATAGGTDASAEKTEKPPNSDDVTDTPVQNDKPTEPMTQSPAAFGGMGGMAALMAAKKADEEKGLATGTQTEL